MKTDTIAAIATTVGESAIGIVRMSGSDAVRIADMIFKARSGRKVSRLRTHTVHYGWITEKPPATGHRPQVIDEVLLTLMRAPKTYTREDIVEISCHGGVRPLQKILEAVVGAGARLAEPGEFTRRAFLNGRIDLSKAEAVLDIIRAKTDTALKLGLAQLSGRLSGIITKMRQALVGVLAHVEAKIDFSEEDPQTKKQHLLERDIAALIRQCRSVIEDSEKSDFFREGIKVTICGRPNVGKSSLLNALLRKERAIVTPIAGTTRDTIEEFISLHGIGIRLVDTAGIIKPKNLIDHHAIRLAKDSIALSDIVLLVFDGSQKLTAKDHELIKELRGKDVIGVINKIDLPRRLSDKELRHFFKHVVCISSKTQKNLALLEKAVVRFVYKGKIIAGEDLVTVNARQMSEIKKAHALLKSALENCKRALSHEFVALDLKGALDCFDRITGDKIDEAVLDRIFGEFCIGK